MAGDKSDKKDKKRKEIQEEVEVEDVDMADGEAKVGFSLQINLLSLDQTSFFSRLRSPRKRELKFLSHWMSCLL